MCDPLQILEMTNTKSVSHGRIHKAGTRRALVDVASLQPVRRIEGEAMFDA